MSKQVKSVFLYGKPTNLKIQKIIEIQEMYTNHLNFFIEKLISDKLYYLDILNNNKQAPKIRELEKSNRIALGSAFGQNCIDYAMKELHNHFIRIRNYLYGVTIDKDINYFVSSIALLNLCIQEGSPEEAEIIIKELIDKLRNKKKLNEAETEKIAFYNEILEFLNSRTKGEISSLMKEVEYLFFVELEERKIPTIKNATIQLDSRLCNIEEAKNIKADFVISIKTLEKHKRIEIPITTSKNGLRRLAQYGMNSPTIKITSKGIVKVTVPFEKEIKNNSDKKTLIGIDVGITDLMYSSNGEAYGNYSCVIKHYEGVVMPKLKQINKLRSLMKKYQKELRDKNTISIRKELLRKKISNINKMLQGKKAKNRILNSYYQMQDKEISIVIKSYLNSIKGTTTTTVVEDLDIIEFDRGKSSNRRNSMWVRGKLLSKLEETLNWHGYDVVKVDPAFTSKLCPKCNNVHKDNRNGKIFKCTQCGHTDDADHNASINIKNRAFDEEITTVVKQYRYNTEKRHIALLELYAKRYEKYKNTAA